METSRGIKHLLNGNLHYAACDLVGSAEHYFLLWSSHFYVGLSRYLTIIKLNTPAD